MSKQAKYLCLVSILIIAIFFRFYHFTTTPPGLYPDEAIDGNNAAEVARTGNYQTFYTEDNGREGLYINIIAILFQYFDAPHEPWVVRLPAAIAGVLTVLGLYLLVAELFGSGTGLLAAFMLATSFWHINFSRIGFRAILAPLLLAWALYLFIKALRSKSSRSAIWYSISSGIVYSLGFYTYIAYRITPLLFLIFIPFFRKLPGFWKRTFIFAIAVFIVAAPIGWYFLTHPSDFFGRTSQISVTSSGSPLARLAENTAKTFLMFNFHGDENWRHNLSGAPELFFPVGVLFLFGIIIGLRALRKDTELPAFSLLLVFAWFLLAFLPVALSDEGIPHALRAILTLPPAMIFGAIGGLWAYRFIRAHWGWKLSIAASGIFLASVTIFPYMQYFVIWANDPNVAGAFNADYVTIGREINSLPSSTPKYVVVEAGGVMTRGLPMPAETTIFITDTFLESEQKDKNVHYLLPEEADKIPPGAITFYIR